MDPNIGRDQGNPLILDSNRTHPRRAGQLRLVQLLFTDGEIVTVAGVENCRQPWRAGVQLEDALHRQADLEDDLVRFDGDDPIRPQSSIGLLSDRQSVEDLHVMGRNSPYSKNEGSISSISGGCGSISPT